MPFSLTYILIAVLAALGVENAESVANALIIVAVAIGALYGRWRAGGLKAWWGKK